MVPNNICHAGHSEVEMNKTNWSTHLSTSTRIGCFLGLALLFASQDAMAQKKKKGKTPVVAQPAPPAAPTAPAAPAAGGDLDLDAPAPGAAPAAPAATPADTGPVGGICEIDPSACPKVDPKAGEREISAEVYAVQQIYALRRNRLELNPYFGATLNDQFVSHPAVGLAANFYISNVLAVGVNGNFYQPFNVDSEFNFLVRRATRISVPLTSYAWNANLNFTYVPMYGKFAGFKNFIFHYDAYIVGGVGLLSTKPIPVIDPDNRNFEYSMKLAFNVGIGLRIFFNRWLALNLEVRDYIYNDKLENTVVSANPQNKDDWFGENRLTNNIQAQLGLSVFIPFSWEYRLQK